MREIIEDTIVRNKAFQKERQQIVDRLIELNAPIGIIEYEKAIAEMTIAEYKSFLRNENEIHKKEILEYAKNNPLKKEIVDEIYRKSDSIEYDEMTSVDYTLFLIKLNPLAFISEDDYEHDLYESFIKHAFELYQKKCSVVTS